MSQVKKSGILFGKCWEWNTGPWYTLDNTLSLSHIPSPRRQDPWQHARVFLSITYIPLLLLSLTVHEWGRILLPLPLSQSSPGPLIFLVEIRLVFRTSKIWVSKMKSRQCQVMYFLLCFSIILTFGKISATPGPFKSHFLRQHNTFWILQGVTLKDEAFQRKHSESHGMLYSSPTHLWSVMYCWGSSPKSPGREITVRDVSKDQEMPPTSRDWSTSFKELQLECELSPLGACVWILGLQLEALFEDVMELLGGVTFLEEVRHVGWHVALWGLIIVTPFQLSSLLPVSRGTNHPCTYQGKAALPSPSLWIFPLESEAILNPSSLNCFWTWRFIASTEN